MGKKGGSQPTNQTVTQKTELPDYAQPYVMNVMSQAQGVASRPYEAYTGARIAPFSDNQLQGFQAAQGIGAVGSGEMNNASNILNGPFAAYHPGAPLNSGYQSATYNPANIQADQVKTGQWSNAQAQKYMSPYLQQVLDSVTARANQQSEMAQVQRNANAKQSGVFGGYRQGVEDAVAKGQDRMNLGELVAQNLNTGYNTAFQNFSTDQARGLEAMGMNQRANLEADLANEQSSQFGANFNDSSNRYGDEARLRFGQFNEGNNLNMARNEQARAQGIAALGQQQQNMAGAGLDALRSTGLDQQRQTQASLDQAYTDFVNQRDYQRNNLNWLNSIIRGNVVGSDSSTITSEAYNPYTQMLGMGVGAVGLYNAMNGGQGGAGATG